MCFWTVLYKSFILIFGYKKGVCFFLLKFITIECIWILDFLFLAKTFLFKGSDKLWNSIYHFLLLLNNIQNIDSDLSMECMLKVILNTQKDSLHIRMKFGKFENTKIVYVCTSGCAYFADLIFLFITLCPHILLVNSA